MNNLKNGVTNILSKLPKGATEAEMIDAVTKYLNAHKSSMKEEVVDAIKKIPEEATRDEILNAVKNQIGSYKARHGKFIMIGTGLFGTPIVVPNKDYVEE